MNKTTKLYTELESGVPGEYVVDYSQVKNAPNRNVNVQAVEIGDAEIGDVDVDAIRVISENLQIINNSSEEIKQAILDRGGTVEGGIATYAAAIRDLPSGSNNSSVFPNDVTFYDYDGTMLHSFSKDEFLALNELPSLPTQPGLTCQGWNYDFSNAKAYVEAYGMLDVGATYITDDGKTRLYIRIAAEGRMDVPLYFQQTVANGVTIDWGDGSPTQTLSGTGNLNTTHTYPSIGNYCITLEVTSGTLELGSGVSSYCVLGKPDNYGRVYTNMLQKVEIGSSVTSIGTYAFYYCTSFASITIPNSVTSIGTYAFYYCTSFASITIPNSVTSIGTYAFAYSLALASITIPNSVTSIGSNAFSNCYPLASIAIPNSVTSIGDYIFAYCYSLASITIPNSVTSIGTYAFYSCYSLASIAIPNSVTSIGSNAFYSCSGTAYFDFSNHTSVPKLLDTSSFSRLSSDFKIVVPDALYTKWKSTTNWSAYSSNIIKKTDWDNL